MREFAVIQNPEEAYVNRLRWTKVKDSNVLLVDDSIVRATTAKQFVKRAREAGAKSVYLVSAAPPIRYPNVYGIDIPSPTELVATGRNSQQICEQIGADYVLYQCLDDLIASVLTNNSDVVSFDTSVFDGKYITGGVSKAFLSQLNDQRSDGVREVDQDAVLYEAVDLVESR